MKLLTLKILLTLFGLTISKIISTTTGDIEGKTIEVLGQEMDVYLGIPYAKPPLRDLRYKPPKPINPWRGVHNAKHNPPPCMQISCFGYCSEDCLFLNIWVPNNPSDSVMVWFYGGSFISGSIRVEEFNGSVIAAIGGVIIASINYRVGPFGYFCSETDDARGNMGMKDQVLGLRWIKDNINAFGGDPSKITIFGQSAGAVSVSTHLVSPLTKGLFKSAIMQSGSAYQPYMVVRNSSVIKWRSTKLAVKLRCAYEDQDISSDPIVMKCMRERSASSIVAADYQIMQNMLVGEDNPGLLFFTPIYGDDYLPNHPMKDLAAGNIHVDTIMSGNVEDEGSAFLLELGIPRLWLNHPVINRSQAASYIRTLFRGLNDPSYQAVVDYYLANTSFFDSSLLKRAYDSVGDWIFDCPCVFLSESCSNNSNKVYNYVYSYKWNGSSNREWMGVAHGEEIPFVFGMPFTEESSFTDEETEFSIDLICAWTSFAIEKKPIYSKISGDWPLYSSSNRVAVDLNPYNVSYRNPYKDSCHFWKEYL